MENGKKEVQVVHLEDLRLFREVFTSYFCNDRSASSEDGICFWWERGGDDFGIA